MNLQTNFLGLLLLLLIGLKLGGVIAWSWWAVTSPLWIPVLSCCLLLMLLGGIYLWQDKQRSKYGQEKPI